MTKRKFRVPHTLVILFSMVVLAQLLTYVIPAGSFERTEIESGRMQVVPGSFHITPDAPAVSPFAALTAIPKGFSSAHEIIFFVFIIGGLFAVLRATGTLDAGMAALLRRWRKRPFLLIAGSMTLFAFGSSTVGFGEEYYPFVPVLVSLCLALGYDRMTAIGIIMVGYGTGYGPAIINPFTTLIAQDIAGLEPASGLWYRLICFFIFVGIGIHHVWSYAKRVGNDPSKSLVADIDVPAGAAIPRDQSPAALDDLPPMTKVQKLIMTAIVVAMVMLIYGMTVWKWGLFEMQGLFAGLTLIIAVIARMSPDETATEFSIGAGSLTSVALLIGVARAIQVVLDEGGIVDTMVYGISVPVQELPGAIAAIGMFFVQSLANFFIPSGSGQAYVTMPIMAPLADLVGVSRQVAVLAFQFGDGFSNILIPTQYVLIGILGMAGIPYDRWLIFVMPLMIKIAIVGSLALVVAVLIGYE
ncbi:MAG: TIGR00366 family protein [Proteobacteria bacterium]|nr:TIGR00366 family protein [Pseudomonadota bacterium]MDA0994128.1 TIGR00366 family protein [Pseudomonadota bacterium]